jgi:hypothetical protein
MVLLTYRLGHNDEYGISWYGGANSAGNLGIKFTVINLGKKTIKYCIVTCAPINRVGDYVSCSITGEVGKQFKMVGPLEPGRSAESAFDGWYNTGICDVKDIKVSILYMDGSSESPTWEQISKNVRLVQQRQQQLQEQEEKRRQKKIQGCFLWVAILIIIIGAINIVVRLLNHGI